MQIPKKIVGDERLGELGGDAWSLGDVDPEEVLQFYLNLNLQFCGSHVLSGFIDLPLVWSEQN